jgi:hypothetical protein
MSFAICEQSYKCEHQRIIFPSLISYLFLFHISYRFAMDMCKEVWSYKVK